MDKSVNDGVERDLFDADLSFDHPTNTSAAKFYGLKWDFKKKYFTDSEGSLVRDRFGQSL